MGRFLPEKTATVFISTGELSGEMHAAHLIDALQALREEQGLQPAIISGNGSARMTAAGATVLFDVATWSEMGILANMMKWQFFRRIIIQTTRYIISNQPDMVVLIDNRFFNTMLARFLRDQGYGGRIVYYVAPVRWESCYDPTELDRSLRNSRFLMIKRYCDFAIPIYPVSLAAYEALDIPHAYYGHPLCSLAKPRLNDKQFAELTGLETGDLDKPLLVGAMPGSRIGEIRTIAPVIYRGLALIAEAFEEAGDLPRLTVASPLAHAELRGEVVAAARRGGLRELTLIDPELKYDLMSRARLMLVKSGTGLHECMLLGAPAVMCYKITPAMAFVARYIMRFSMPYYGFPNLLAGRPIVPELIQDDCTHTRIAEIAGSLMFNEKERKAMTDAFKEMREHVCKPDPLRNIAAKLQDLLPR